MLPNFSVIYDLIIKHEVNEAYKDHDNDYGCIITVDKYNLMITCYFAE